AGEDAQHYRKDSVKRQQDLWHAHDAADHQRAVKRHASKEEDGRKRDDEVILGEMERHQVEDDRRPEKARDASQETGSQANRDTGSTFKAGSNPEIGAEEVHQAEKRHHRPEN